MTWPAIVILVVALASLPAGWWNVSAAVLVLSWATAQGYWLYTGNNLPLAVYVLCDIAVLGAIYCKTPVWDNGPYRTFWDHVSAFVLEKSISDRIVILIFPMVWLLYILPMDATPRWYMLWALKIAQFLAVTTETYFRLYQWHKEHHASRLPPPWLFRLGRKAGVG